MVTVTSTVPAACAGATAVIDVADFTVKLVAAVPPKETAVAPFRFFPLMVTVVPPAVGPEVGLMPVTVGWATYVNWAAAEVAEVPPAVVTVTSTLPAACAGLVAVSVVAEVTATLVAVLPPKLTVAPGWKLVPVIVTVVPPAVGPAVGLTALTVGLAT